jgi:SET domain-containing protein
MKNTNDNNDHPQTNNIEALEDEYLYYKKSQIDNAGHGLFTVIDIYENEVISLFEGEIISNEEAIKREKAKENGYFINMLDGSIMDSKHVDCFAKYANDAEGMKETGFKNNSQITLDEEDNVCLTATQDIPAGEEIFCGYGKPYWKNKNQ